MRFPAPRQVQIILSCDTAAPAHAQGFGPRAKKAVSGRKGWGRGRRAAAAGAEWWAGDAEDGVKYLVKWRGLPYSEASWEDFGLLRLENASAVARFWARERSPPNRAVRTPPFPFLL